MIQRKRKIGQREQFVYVPSENWSNKPIWTHPVGIAVPDTIRTTDAGFMFVVATDYLDNPE